MTASRRWPPDFALTPVHPVDPDPEPAAITVQVEPEELTVAETATATTPSRVTSVSPSREVRSMPTHSEQLPRSDRRRHH